MNCLGTYIVMLFLLNVIIFGTYLKNKKNFSLDTHIPKSTGTIIIVNYIHVIYRSYFTTESQQQKMSLFILY